MLNEEKPKKNFTKNKLIKYKGIHLMHYNSVLN